jgi:hypothetical protein
VLHRYWRSSCESDRFRRRMLFCRSRCLGQRVSASKKIPFRSENGRNLVNANSCSGSPRLHCTIHAPSSAAEDIFCMALSQYQSSMRSCSGAYIHRSFGEINSTNLTRKILMTELGCKVRENFNTYWGSHFIQHQGGGSCLAFPCMTRMTRHRQPQLRVCMRKAPTAHQVMLASQSSIPFSTPLIDNFRDYGH